MKNQNRRAAPSGAAGAPGVELTRAEAAQAAEDLYSRARLVRTRIAERAYTKKKTLPNALKALDIYDYKDRIFTSNSRGEQFFLIQYFDLADNKKIIETWLKEKTKYRTFREWFVDLVAYAEEEWDRPESIFQHVERQLLGI